MGRCSVTEVLKQKEEEKKKEHPGQNTPEPLRSSEKVLKLLQSATTLLTLLDLH